MAVVSVKDLFAGASGSAGTRKYTRTLRVRTNSRTDGPVAVTSDPRVPQVGDYYLYRNEADVDSLAEEPQARQEGPYQWTVTVSYRPRNQNKPDQKRPETDPIKRSGSGFTVDYSDGTDMESKPFQNSAGHPYDYISTPLTIGVYRVSYNRASWSVDQTLQYLNSVNASTYKGWKARSLKIANIEWSEERTDYGVAYVKMSVEVHCHPDTWDVKVLDQGPFWLRDATTLQEAADAAKSNGKLRTFPTDADGTKAMLDVLLDGKGEKLKDGKKPVFNTFKRHKTSNFNLILR